MGLARDLGAAITMGLMATTRHKEIDQANRERSEQHQSAADKLNTALNQSGKSVNRMTDQCRAIGTAMETTGLDSTMIPRIEQPQWQTILPIQPEDIDGSVKIFLGITTRMTTTAWGGHILSLGVANFTIRRIALGAIEILTMALQILIGARTARHRERNAARQAETLSSYLASIEAEFEAFPAPLEQCRESAKIIETSLYTNNRRINHNPESISPETVETIHYLAREAQTTANDFSRLAQKIREQFKTDQKPKPCLE